MVPAALLSASRQACAQPPGTWTGSQITGVVLVGMTVWMTVGAVVCGAGVWTGSKIIGVVVVGLTVWMTVGVVVCGAGVWTGSHTIWPG